MIPFPPTQRAIIISVTLTRASRQTLESGALADPHDVLEDPNGVLADPHDVLEDLNGVLADPHDVLEDLNGVLADPRHGLPTSANTDDCVGRPPTRSANTKPWTGGPPTRSANINSNLPSCWRTVLAVTKSHPFDRIKPL